MSSIKPKANSQQPTAIPYGKQNITEEDIKAVVEVLKSDYLTQGPKIAEFEKEFANYVGSKYAIAVSNGTAALHLNALALGVKSGDKVITTPITFAASANCVRYCGGEVVFSDIDPKTYLLDIENVRELLEADTKKEIKGIIPVDFAGRAVDLEAFRKLADEFNCWIIEDSCHSPGGFFTDSKGQKQHCGNGNFADLAIFSFHPVKHIAAGEGGMITTNDETLYQKLTELRTHGITKDSSKFQNNVHLALGDWQLAKSQQPTANSQEQAANSQQLTANSYPNWYMEMQNLGYNYRLTDFQAALGLSQLKRANKGLIKRHEIAARYFEAFKSIPQITDRNIESNTSQTPTANSQSPTAESKPTANSQQLTANAHAHHLYVIEVENRLGLYNYLRENHIYTQIHYIPCHLMPYYKEQGWKEGDLPNAEAYYTSCISLPMFPSLKIEEQEFVIKKIKEFLKQ
ncbi:aminotransferase class I/II-fold pyridoxal phosphate-dependent enzyme [Psychroflexus aestuariivivens]|uniref:aminotransferase class I/II-fold pyridoxal phosphate-dependent enzyme n=1 Tax=Psychroflexus aestuariivivens TaxID=1795040 RepID=UPI000FD8D639|nr:aminotransferase class I/II-fold pyridoxal phosphate-dependent enzyme [Psychroflexus aestuariivivens]